jgi:hypothetical protein
VVRGLPESESGHAAIMPRLALEVADVFRVHGPEWSKANAGHVILRPLQRALVTARTPGRRIG